MLPKSRKNLQTSDDLGATYTDDKIRTLEKAIKREYGRAQKEIQQSIQKLAADTAKEEQKMLALLKNGAITQERFDQWKAHEAFRTKSWETQEKNIADTMYRANTIATQMVRGEQYDVFAFNANYAAYAIDRGIGGTVGFDLYSKESVARLLKDKPNILPFKKLDKTKDVKWNFKNIRSEITQGILQGKSIPKIAEALSKVVPNRNAEQMVKHARTAMTSAQNGGRMERYRQAEDLGIKMKKVWVATLDSRTRETHRDLDGQAVDVDEDFTVDGMKISFPGDPHADPSLTYNCFTAETGTAVNGDIEAVFRHQYEGDLITITTACGVKVTCTPNHPILTRRGWVPAQFLNEGDEVAVTFSGHKRLASGNPHVNHGLARFDTLRELFSKTPTERADIPNVNFHGDIPTSNVEVVRKEGFLRKYGDTSHFQHQDKLPLKTSDAFTFGFRHLVKRFRAVLVSASGLLSRACQPLAFFFRRLTHPQEHGLRPIALFYPGGVQPWDYGCSGDAEILGELLHGFAGIVCGDQVVNIDVRSSKCHVFNLQSEYGYYFVNSIPQNAEKYNGIVAIAQNCRCTMITRLADYPASLQRRVQETGEKVDANMTYREWEKMQNAKQEPEKEKNAYGIEYDTPQLLPVFNDKDGTMTEYTFMVHKQEEYGFPNGTANGVYQKRDADIYELENGTKFIQPTDMDGSKQSENAVFFMERYMQVPESYRDQIQKTVHILDYRNPQDAKWAQRYHMKNFRSYATGGTEISFYANTDHDADYVVRTFAHEGGHYVDLWKPGAGKMSESAEWARAIKSDKAVSGQKGVSSYAQVHVHEDFAESCAVFVTDPERMKKDFPNRYSLLETIIGGK